MAALLPGLDQQLDAAAPQALDQQVKSVLAQMMHGERPSIEATARHLCLSPRTLQRRLTEMHTSYQPILDEVRLDVAQSCWPTPRWTPEKLPSISALKRSILFSAPSTSGSG
ncbi:hypothetical protein [Rhodoferax sp.]|uniref:hypothetical protein n=1 Tax=Rhodoferax sp. TaxID=50421 RepID=UPI0025FB7BD1|nr:hypothetical protein [Rhodoferax sp.]